MADKREVWVDNIKVFACMLVVLGHFFQSMIKSEILPANNLYTWFNQTIYFFHVQLFFISSGYLYQKLSVINKADQLIRNVLTKAVALGIPYFTFSFMTWILKRIFSGAVNNEIGGLFETLFLSPTAPYWYLYALFFVFLITPTFSQRKKATIGFGFALISKIINILCGATPIYALSVVMENEIWFVIGMCISIFNITELRRRRSFGIFGVVGILFFCGTSVLLYAQNIDFLGKRFILGLDACISFFIIFMTYMDRPFSPFKYLARYTMPIFLMHTLFAAPLRSGLIKIGIVNPAFHIALGIAISIVGPIIATKIMKLTKILEFFIYPTKFIKISS